MSNQLYYLISLGIVGIIGTVTKIKPIGLILLYYPITKFILTYFQPSIPDLNMNELDDFYMFIPNILKNIGKVFDFITEWIIEPPINFIKWIFNSLKNIITFIKDAFLFFITTVPNYIIDVLFKIINTFIIEPLKWITEYLKKITNWFNGDKAIDYFEEVIVNAQNLYFFQWQELLNFFIEIVNKYIPGLKLNKITEINLDEKYFMLGFVQNHFESLL
jgi:hypothetical protein